MQTTFYVTESSAFRNRILYFRQDDWSKLCAPLIEKLSSDTFEKLEQVIITFVPAVRDVSNVRKYSMRPRRCFDNASWDSPLSVFFQRRVVCGQLST